MKREGAMKKAAKTKFLQPTNQQLTEYGKLSNGGNIAVGVCAC